MAAPDPPSSSSFLRRRRRRSRLRRTLGHIWAEWRVEAFIVLLLAAGVFLIVERRNIRQTLLHRFERAVQAIWTLSESIRQGLDSFVHKTTFSNVVGSLLVFVAIAFVTWRIRWRLITAPRFAKRVCPRCGSALHRIHRHSLDHVINLFVPVRRYRCGNRECSWRGLRVGRSLED